MIRPVADELLAKLVANAASGPVDFVVLQAVIEEASEAGAYRALAALGLEDVTARRDMDELRELLSGWRDVKRSALRTVGRWCVRILLATLMIALAFRFDLRNLVEP